MVFQPEGWGSRSFEEVTNLVILLRAALKLPLEMHEGEAPGISCEGLSQYYLNDLQTFFPDSFVAKVAAARCHHNECAAPPCPDQITETTLPPPTCILYNSNGPKSERAERGPWRSGILEKCTSLEAWRWSPAAYSTILQQPAAPCHFGCRATCVCLTQPWVT